jgi:hypothetical protein
MSTEKPAGREEIAKVLEKEIAAMIEAEPGIQEWKIMARVTGAYVHVEFKEIKARLDRIEKQLGIRK